MKHITVELRLDESTDVYDSAVQEGLVEACKTTEGVLDARVVGVSEQPDPAPAPGPDADNPPSDEINQG